MLRSWKGLCCTEEFLQEFDDDGLNLENFKLLKQSLQWLLACFSQQVVLVGNFYSLGSLID